MKQKKRLENIREEIMSLAEEEYRDFQIRLLPDTENFVGVRLPELRKLAKRIAKQNAEEYLEAALQRKPQEELFEEIMLQGMVIGYMETNISDIFSYTAEFIPKIDNWSVCDSFCSGYKHAKKYRQETWEFLSAYLQSKQEFEIRFGVVMLLNYYIEESQIKELFLIFNQIEHPGYYVKMAVAWAVSICYIKYPKPTWEYLNNNQLDIFTYNKALQKITESHCITKAEKDKIRRMKKLSS